jgi:hypothetical protein
LLKARRKKKESNADATTTLLRLQFGSLPTKLFFSLETTFLERFRAGGKKNKQSGVALLGGSPKQSAFQPAYYQPLLGDSHF